MHLKVSEALNIRQSPSLSSFKVAIYKLYYFPVRGRGQAIKYLLEDNDIKYEWVNIAVPDYQAWVTKYKPMMIFGQCPMLEDGECQFQICQSNAILRYLGRKHGLSAENIQDEARMDMVMDHIEDIRVDYVRMIYTNYEAGKDEFIKSLPDKFRPLENLLKKWGNEQILSKMTLIDYNVFDKLDDLLILSSDCLKEFPPLQAFHTRMANRPKLKAYREKEDFKQLPIVTPPMGDVKVVICFNTRHCVVNETVTYNTNGVSVSDGESRITLVDYTVFDMLDDLLILSSDCLKEFPLLQAFHTRMANRPKLKAYRDTEEFRKLPVNGNDKQ